MTNLRKKNRGHGKKYKKPRLTRHGELDKRIYGTQSTS